MRSVALIIAVLGFHTVIFSQAVGINTTGASPHASAILDISSDTKGVLFPRMTTAQRTAISAPATGLTVFDTDTHTQWVFNGTLWTNQGGGGLTLPYAGTISESTTAFSISNTGNALEGFSGSGSGLYATSGSGAGVYALSYSGAGVFANSTQGSSVYAYGNNSNPTIYASNSNSLGVAIKGNAPTYDAILGVSGGYQRAGVRGEATGAYGHGVYGTASEGTGIGLYGYAPSGVGTMGYSSTGTALKGVSLSGLALDVQGKVKISGGNTNPSYGAVLSSDASGNATWLPRIGFGVKGIPSGETNIPYNYFRKVEFENEVFDFGNTWYLYVNGSGQGTSVMTIPLSGVYAFSAQVGLAPELSRYSWGILHLMLKRNGATSILARTDYNAEGDDAWLKLQLHTTEKLQAGDQIWLEVMAENGDQNTTYLDPADIDSFFSGYLIFKN